MKLSRCFLILLVLWGGCLRPSYAKHVPSISVPFVSQPATNSLVPGSAVWHRSISITDFRTVLTGERESAGAICNAVRDRAALLLRCEDFGPLLTHEPKADDLMKGDYIAIAIFSVGNGAMTTRTFIINPRGEKVARDATSKIPWDPRWQSAVYKTPIGWTMYLSLPLTSITAKDDHKWRMSILIGKTAAGTADIWPYVSATPKAPMSYAASAEVYGL